jgi:hypothetical protein
MAEIKSSLMINRPGSLFALSRSFFTQRVQFVFLIAFALINTVLFLNAVPVIHDAHNVKPLHPAYAGAADGQRYWGVANNLIKYGTFQYGDTPADLRPLQRGGPVPPLVYAGLMSLVDFDNAPLLIVTLQCVLLYLVSLLSRNFAAPFLVNRDLVQGLILFNPSLIGLAHHAQSEILFLCFFSVLLWLCIRLLSNGAPSRYLFLSVGITAGLLLLTRPAGLPFLLLLPCVLFASVYLSKKQMTVAIKTLFRQILPACLVTALIATPWVMHNYQEFGRNGFTSGKTSVLTLNFLLLKGRSQSTAGLSPKDQVLVDLVEQAINKNLNPCCAIGSLSRVVDVSAPSDRYQCETTSLPTDCDKILASSYLAAMGGHSMGDWARALLSAWISTYLSGGIASISSYLGLQAPDRALLYAEYEGLSRYWTYFFTAMSTFPGYFILFLAGTAFALIGRLTGVIGLITSINKRSLLPYHVLYVSPIIIFTATYLLIGVSRFRAHLEPILAVYAAIGIVTCLHAVRTWLSKPSPQKKSI